MNAKEDFRTDKERRPGKRKKDSDIKLCTWNVRTLNRPAATRLLADQLAKYKADITALQEMRWKGEGVRENREYNIYYSCHGDYHTFGTGFFVNHRLKHLVIDFKAINNRICTLRIKGKFRNFSIINAHAPTEESTEEDKDEWYDKLQNVCNSCPAYDVKIVIGDMNAKVGKEDEYEPTIGRHSLHDVCNDNGTKLVNFAMSNNMVIGSTKFPHKRIHKGTWVSPEGSVCNQIDHILIDGRHASNLMDVKTQRGANIDSDHYLVIARIRARISTAKLHKSERATKFNCDKLKDIEVRNEYQQKLKEKLRRGSSRELSSPEQFWNNIKACIVESATEILGMKQSQNRSCWFDDECEEVTNKKNEARLRLQQIRTRRAIEDYKQKRHLEKKMHKKKKRQYEDDQALELSECYAKNNSRSFYHKVNSQRKGFKPRNIAIRSKEGLIINDKVDILSRWTNYFKELLNPNMSQITVVDASDETENETENEVALPHITETRTALQKLKNNKAPGCDAIPGELLKYGGMTLQDEIHQLVVSIWTTEVMPEEWALGLICPLHKKGDTMECSNYRGITLLNTCYKVLANIIYTRLLPYSEQNVGDYQCGFRPNRSTIDQIFSLRQILEKMLEFNLTTHHVFIDFKAAYDSITRVKLFEALKEFQIPTKLISLVKMTLKQTVNQVKIQNDLGDRFPTLNGLRQGDALSCLLFNMVLEKCIRDSQTQTMGTIFYKSSQILGYADDIDLIARNLDTLKQEYMRIKTAAENVGLNINTQKTMYMLSTKSEAAPHSQVTIGDEVIKECSNFVYLGSQVTSNNDISSEIRRRIAIANRAFYGLKNHFKSRFLSRHVKTTLYKTLIRPVLTYGSECWAISKKDEEALHVFERRILRSIYGAVRVNGLWRIRYNFELYNIFNEPNVVQHIKIARLQWAGHVQRMDEHRPPKKLMSSHPDGRRSIGRPRLRWLDGVDQDAKRIGLRGWKTSALDRDEWRNLLEQARAHKGL